MTCAESLAGDGDLSCRPRRRVMPPSGTLNVAMADDQRRLKERKAQNDLEAECGGGSVWKQRTGSQRCS